MVLNPESLVQFVILFEKADPIILMYAFDISLPHLLLCEGKEGRQTPDKVELDLINSEMTSIQLYLHGSSTSPITVFQFSTVTSS